MPPILGTALGIGASLLGGLLGGSGDKSPEQKQLPTMTPQQLELLNSLIGMVQPQIGQNIESYPGMITPQLNPMLQQYMGQASQFGQNPIYQQGMGVLQNAMQGQPLFGQDMDAARQYWTDAFLNPAMSTFKSDVLRPLEERYAGMGALDSGGFKRATGRAATDMFTQGTGQLANLMWGEQQAGRDELVRAQQQALGAVPGAMQYAQTPLEMLLGAGQMQYGQEQAMGQEKAQKWQMEQPWNNPYLQMAGGLLSQQAFQPYLEQPAPSAMNIFGQSLASGGATGLGLGLGNMMAQGSGLDWTKLASKMNLLNLLPGGAV